MIKSLLTDILNKDILSSMDRLIEEVPPIASIDNSSMFSIENICEAVQKYFSNNPSTKAEVYIEDALILKDRSYRIMNIKLTDAPEVQESYLLCQFSDEIFCYSVTYKTHSLLYTASKTGSNVIMKPGVNGDGYSEALMDELNSVLKAGMGEAVVTETDIIDDMSPIDISADDNIMNTNQAAPIKTNICSHNNIESLSNEDSPLLDKMNLSGRIWVNGGEFEFTPNELSIFFYKDTALPTMKAITTQLQDVENISLYKYVDYEKYAMLFGSLCEGLQGEDLGNYVYECSSSEENDTDLFKTTMIDNVKHSIFLDVADDRYVCLPYEENVNRYPVIVPEYEVTKKVEGEDITLYDKDILTSSPGSLENTNGNGLYTEASLTEMISRISEKIVGLPKDLYNKYRELVGRMRALIKRIRDARDDDDRDMVINGEFIPELTLAIRLLISVGVAYPLYLTGILGPIGAVMAGMTAYILKKYSDEVRRDNAFRMISNEIRVIDEKIEDARAANDNEKKVTLMRIRDELGERMRRARFNMPATGNRVI